MLVLVVVAGAFVAFRFVPTQVTYQSQTANPTDSSSDRSSSSDVSDVDQVLPYRDLELQRAEEDAKSILSEFAALQDQVEAEQLGLLNHRQTYDEIIDAANQADASFARREYDLAISQYQDATTRLREYVFEHETTFEEAFENGYTSLVDRDLNAARDLLGQAHEIKPNDTSLAIALGRLEKLPQVNSLIRESGRARYRGDFEQAELLLLRAQEIDPATQGIDDSLREIRRIQQDEDFRAVLTQAYTALSENRLHDAKQGFESALRMRPGDSGATTGLSEAINRLGNTTIGELKESAERYERDGDLRSAMGIYAEALEIDNNLQFARDGYERTQTTIRIVASLERILADPHSLSSNKEFEFAQQTLRDAREHASIDTSYSSKVNKLATLIDVASRPLPIVLVSDNEMEVRLATIGDLGPFERKELTLRPGRYLLTGSGNGCRDVRKTIVVSEGMEPISIVCIEPI